MFLFAGATQSSNLFFFKTVMLLMLIGTALTALGTFIIFVYSYKQSPDGGPDWRLGGMVWTFIVCLVALAVPLAWLVSCALLTVSFHLSSLPKRYIF